MSFKHYINIRYFWIKILPNKHSCQNIPIKHKWLINDVDIYSSKYPYITVIHIYKKKKKKQMVFKTLHKFQLRLLDSSMEKGFFSSSIIF